VEEQAACFVVRDHNGQQLAYVYFEEEPGATLGGQAADARRGPGALLPISPSCHS
jgi:hypothetical protein